MGSQVAHELGDLFAQLLAARGEGNGLEDSRGLRDAGVLCILELRKVHRAMCEDGEALRQASTDAKIQLDQSSLQLQNLLYEKHHYEKEIRAARSFRSAFRDEQLELLLEDEFAAHPAAEGLVVDDAHQLMLNRLKHELQFRQETLQQLDPLKARRDALAADVAQRRAAVSGLEADAAKLRVAAAKVRERYDIPVPGLADSSKLAALLPLPLYLLHTQLSAAAAGRTSVAVRVTGEEADALTERLQHAMFLSPSASAVAADAAVEAVVGGAFPLGVTVSITPPGSQEPALSATFRYLPSERLVTVAGASAEQDGELAALFEGDTGSLLAAGAEAGQGGAQGRPFVWAQRAAGLDVLPALPSDAAGASSSALLPEVAAAVQQYQRDSTAAAVLDRLVRCAGGGAI